MIVIDDRKGYGRFTWHFLCVDAELGLNSTGIEGPKICCLLYFVVLVQALAHPGDLGKIRVDI